MIGMWCSQDSGLPAPVALRKGPRGWDKVGCIRVVSRWYKVSLEFFKGRLRLQVLTAAYERISVTNSRSV